MYVLFIITTLYCSLFNTFHSFIFHFVDCVERYTKEVHRLLTIIEVHFKTCCAASNGSGGSVSNAKEGDKVLNDCQCYMMGGEIQCDVCFRVYSIPFNPYRFIDM